MGAEKKIKKRGRRGAARATARRGGHQSGDAGTM